MTKNKLSEISIKVELDKKRIPENIYWSAEDGNIKNHPTKAFLLSVWDDETREALKIDLWTKDMDVEQMKVFFYQTLISMKDTYFRATDDQKMRDTMNDFCEYFAEKTGTKN